MGCRSHRSGDYEPDLERAQVRGRAPRRGFVRVEASQAVVVVRDHGIGIPEDEQSKIFGPFARVVAAKHHAGLGLGLWIAQQIVQASGGRIKVDSRPEQGSTFTVELPL